MDQIYNHPLPRRCIRCKTPTGARYICAKCNRQAYAPLKKPKYCHRPAAETGKRLTAERMRDPSGVANVAAIDTLPVLHKLQAAAILSKFGENTALSSYLITHYVAKGRANDIVTMTSDGARFFESEIARIVDSGVVGKWNDDMRATKPRAQSFTTKDRKVIPPEWTAKRSEFQQRYNAARAAAVEGGAKEMALRAKVLEAGGRFI